MLIKKRLNFLTLLTARFRQKKIAPLLAIIIITLLTNLSTFIFVLDSYASERVKITNPSTGFYDDRYVNVDGDTMTGALTVNNNDGVDNETMLTIGDVDDLDNLLVYGTGTFGGASAGQSLIASGLVVNDDGGATAADDLRVETDTQVNALVVDASGNDIEINVNTAIIGTLGVTGVTTITGATNITGNSTLTGELYVSGDTGIGTITPSTPLHVWVSNVLTATPQLYIEQDSTGDASLEWGIVGDSYIMGIDNSAGDNFAIAYSSTQGGGVLGTNNRITISSFGSVDVPGGFSANSLWGDTYISCSAGDITAVDGAVSANNEAVTIVLGDTTFAVDSNCVTLTSDGVGNNVTTITGGINGQILTLIFVDALVVLIDDNNHGFDTLDLTGNLNPAADTVLQLIFNGNNWFQVAAPSVN